MPVTPLTGTPHLVKLNWFFVVDDLDADSELVNEQAALKSVTKEQTASLQTALLHGHIGLVCGPGCEPLSGVCIPCPVDIDDSSHQGLVELDLSLASSG